MRICYWSSYVELFRSVWVADGGMGGALPTQYITQHFLGRGLADTAGDADHFGAATLARRTGEIVQRLEGVFHLQQVGARRQGLRHAVDQRRGCAFRQRIGNEDMAVEIRAAQGNEEITDAGAAAEIGRAKV